MPSSLPAQPSKRSSTNSGCIERPANLKLCPLNRAQLRISLQWPDLRVDVVVGHVFGKREERLGELFDVGLGTDRRMDASQSMELLRQLLHL